MPVRNRINREATGLLGFLRAKVGGQQPIDLKTDVQPVIEISPFVGVSTVRGVVVENNGSPPSNISIEVPSDEAWLIHTMSLTLWSAIGWGANEGADWALQIQGLTDADGAVQDVTLGGAGRTFRPAVAADTGVSTFSFTPSNLILPAGTRIQGQFLYDDTAAAYDVKVGVIYSSMRV